MIDGMKVKGTIASTRLDALPTGTLYVELGVNCQIDGEHRRVPTKIFVTEKAGDRARTALKSLGFDILTQHIAMLNTGEKSPLQGKTVEIFIKETNWGIQGELAGSGGIDKAKIEKMQAMLGGSMREPGNDEEVDLPF